MTKDKTLLVTLDFPPLLGGVANYYFERVKAMSKDEIVVLVDELKTEGLKLEMGAKIYRFKFLQRFIWPHWLFLIWYIYKIVKKEKINKIWVGQVLPVGTAVWVVSKILNIPYFVSCHGNDLLRAKKNKRKFKLAKKILADAEFVEANTEFTKNILVNDFEISAERIKIVYPINTLKKAMVDLQKVGELKEKYNLKDKKVLLTVGRLVESKGIDLVLQALPKVWQSVPNLVYLVIGDGPDKNRLMQIVNKLPQNIKPNIVFVGAVPYLELPNYYALASAFILTPRSTPLIYKERKGEVNTDTESFGVVYLEAQEFGLPVVAGKVGGALEIAKNYNQMHLIDSENNNEIIEKIIEIIK